MIRLLLILMLFLAGQAQGTIALVTGNIFYSSGATTVTTSGAITISPSMTTGQYLVVAVSGGSGFATVLTNAELIGQFSFFGGSSAFQLFALYRATGTVSSFTVNVGAGVSLGLTVEAAVFSATNQLRIDRSNTGTATSASIATSAVGTTASANELWIGLAALRGISGATFSSAQLGGVNADNTYFASTAIGTAASERACALWYRLVSATGTPTATVTASASGVYSAVIVCLEETPAGAAAGEVSYGFSQ